jgi:molybdopterin converting factor small subunit
MIVHIPSPLLSYTNAKQVNASGATLAELFANLENRFPGIRFRVIDEQDHIREHLQIFVNQRIAKDLNERIEPSDQVRIIAAISGG